jgi:galactosamine-6-phosphate isomerase
MNPSICICNNHESLSQQAAERIVNALATKPNLLLCAAGGSTPLRTYQLLAKHRARKHDLARSMRVVKLDEWGGIALNEPGSCEHQLRTHLVDPLGLSDDRYFGFNSQPADAEAECRRLGNWLASEGPIDLCVLGLGTNGHVAMNEPTACLQPAAHVARLTEATLAHSMLADARSKPTFGLTLGMAEILAAQEILLLVSGASKREPLRKLLRREITTEFPASFVWLHPNWTLLCDRAAAEGLDLKS